MTADDHLLRVWLEEGIRSLEADIAFYEARRIRTIADAPTLESGMAGAAVWDALIGERSYTVGYLRGALRATESPEGADPMTVAKYAKYVAVPSLGDTPTYYVPESESEKRAAWGDR